MRSLLRLAILCGMLAVPAHAQEGGDLAPAVGTITLDDIATARERLMEMSEQAIIMDAACCRVCSKGKACGNSCISRSKRCHKGPGCACDG